MLGAKGEPYQVLDLVEQDVMQRTELFKQMEQKLIIEADKFIIVMPEYNGSYPGILKMLIDNSNTRTAWKGKKVLLTGVSTGRAGNLRGMEHLTGCLLHMQMVVHPNRLPISKVGQMLGADGDFEDEETKQLISHQLTEFINF